MNGFGGTYPFHFPAFDDAQQVGLLVCGHIANFIQKQGPAVGQFKAADSIGPGIGKRTLDVAKEFAQECAFR